MTIRVLLADDHWMVRAGLRTLIDRLSTATVVGEAEDGVKAIDLARELAPDVVVMDISMKGLNGFEATRLIITEQPAIRVLMLSMHQQLEFVRRALESGAHGYILKSGAVAELSLALEKVMRGETYLSPEFVDQESSADTGFASLESLSAPLLTFRQMEVLELIGRGHNTKQIALQLGLSIKTIEAHRSQIMERLRVHDAANMILEAVKHGLIQVD